MRKMEEINILDEIKLSDEKLNELSGSKLSYDQIQALKYELIGRILTEKVNILDTYTGRIQTTHLFDAIVKMAALSDVYLITPDRQPLFNIRNEYMGFIFDGKVINIKKEKNSRKNRKMILFGLTSLGAFVVGLTAPIISVIAFIVALTAFGYSAYLSIKE